MFGIQVHVAQHTHRGTDSASSCLHSKALVAAIRGRAQHTANFVDALEAKYSKKRPAADGGGPSASRKPSKRGDSSK